MADYHVLTWRTSHFHHPRNRTVLTGAFSSKLEDGAAAASSVQKQPEGIGVGFSDAGRTNWRQGGLGTDGMLPYGTKDAAGNEVLSAARKTPGRQRGAPEVVTSVMQPEVPEEMYSVVNSARASLLKVHSRIRRSTAKLREIFLRQQTKRQQAGVSARQGSYRRQPEKEMKGTRRADREEVLSMQAQNHYLLDSYDKKGQYSMLGK